MTIDDVPKWRYRIYLAIWYTPHALCRALMLAALPLVMLIGTMYPVEAQAVMDGWADHIEKISEEMQAQILKYKER